MAAKNRFNQNWMHDHINDPYVKLAAKLGYRARAAFKLIEIDDQDRLIAPGMNVVDLGSTPGAWSQVVSQRLGRAGDSLRGRIIALDLLSMVPIPGVEFIQGDFREPPVLAMLEQSLAGAKLDLVISDMAPNLSGIGSADAARMAELVELAVQFAMAHLKPQGALLTKVFHGVSYDESVQLFRRHFEKVQVRKPKASKDRSAETYLLGRVVKKSINRRPSSDDHSGT